MTSVVVTQWLWVIAIAVLIAVVRAVWVRGVRASAATVVRSMAALSCWRITVKPASFLFILSLFLNTLQWVKPGSCECECKGNFSDALSDTPSLSNCDARKLASLEAGSLKQAYVISYFVLALFILYYFLLVCITVNLFNLFSPKFVYEFYGLCCSCCKNVYQYCICGCCIRRISRKLFLTPQIRSRRCDIGVNKNRLKKHRPSST